MKPQWTTVVLFTWFEAIKNNNLEKVLFREALNKIVKSYGIINIMSLNGLHIWVFCLLNELITYIVGYNLFFPREKCLKSKRYYSFFSFFWRTNTKVAIYFSFLLCIIYMYLSWLQIKSMHQNQELLLQKVSLCRVL